MQYLEETGKQDQSYFRKSWSHAFSMFDTYSTSGSKTNHMFFLTATIKYFTISKAGRMDYHSSIIYIKTQSVRNNAVDTHLVAYPVQNINQKQ